MEAQLNPFQPGAGLVPPELVGRDEHINAFDVLIQRARHRLLGRGMMLYGLRAGNIIGISFHPEVTGDTTVHEELLSLIR